MLSQKIKLPFNIKFPVVGLGAHTKNTVCFARGNLAYLSPEHTDLNSIKDFLCFEKATQYFLKSKPKIIAYDLHPEYQSTKYAHRLQATGYRLQAVQHHHAHIASCMAENGLKNQKVIGVAFDGTGLGIDNTLWGAEFLICDYKNFKRSAHLKEIPLLGGQQAIIEPWRLAAAWLYAAYQDGFLKLNIEFTKRINRRRWQILKDMHSKGLNSPLASSMGRFFDAVASIILVKFQAGFEAELAMELERLAISYQLSLPIRQPWAISYSFQISKAKNTYIIDPIAIFKGIITDLKAKEAKNKIAYKFHLTVAQMIQKACLILRKEAKINKVVLSGGVFQNNLLLTLCSDLLHKERFQIFMHKRFSCNDSCIALGQVAIANFNH